MTAPLAVTLGDPAGIGPEIAARCILAPDAPDAIAIGQPQVLRRALDLVAPDVVIRLATPQTPRAPGEIRLLATEEAKPPPEMGKVSAASGRAAYDAIARAIQLARTGAVAGIVTAPIHKAALAAAGVPYPGHTEMLADLGGATRVAMMLANDEIRTVLVTIHVSLRDAIAQADHAAQMTAIRLAHDGCRAFGIRHPRVAVAGLNPHAGEDGLFGREEIEIIRPAIEAARQEGIDATGPWPGDTVFMQARAGRFDVVVAQYHDQGLIPVKYMGLEKGVNITLGLPFVRTSPDHGTAFDIAGRGSADPASMMTALSMAATLARHRQTVPG
ncbi:4-hydroxythreonine-4-phosphate dehydrogenase PdxA [Pseudooceanicola sp. C21-150M6]|uniref:4-hydroxythreonine-4-phosphate dehydrogenase PdxA n=1 Tax=Pseudooceanicola sp. C21-150M6 TaxID=3434355 RepID=UPI003D7F9D53